MYCLLLSPQLLLNPLFPALCLHRRVVLVPLTPGPLHGLVPWPSICVAYSLSLGLHRLRGKTLYHHPV